MLLKVGRGKHIAVKRGLPEMHFRSPRCSRNARLPLPDVITTDKVRAQRHTTRISLAQRHRLEPGEELVSINAVACAGRRGITEALPQFCFKPEAKPVSRCVPRHSELERARGTRLCVQRVIELEPSLGVRN